MPRKPWSEKYSLVNHRNTSRCTRFHWVEVHKFVQETASLRWQPCRTLGYGKHSTKQKKSQMTLISPCCCKSENVLLLEAMRTWPSEASRSGRHLLSPRVFWTLSQRELACWPTKFEQIRFTDAGIAFLGQIGKHTKVIIGQLRIDRRGRFTLSNRKPLPAQLPSLYRWGLASSLRVTSFLLWPASVIFHNLYSRILNTFDVKRVETVKHYNITW